MITVPLLGGKRGWLVLYVVSPVSPVGTLSKEHHGSGLVDVSGDVPNFRKSNREGRKEQEV